MFGTNMISRSPDSIKILEFVNFSDNQTLLAQLIHKNVLKGIGWDRAQGGIVGQQNRLHRSDAAAKLVSCNRLLSIAASSSLGCA